MAIALPPYPASKGVLPNITRKFQSAVHPTPAPYIPHHPDLIFFVYVIHIVPFVGSKAEVWWRLPCNHTPPLWACFLKDPEKIVDSQAEVWWRSP